MRKDTKLKKQLTQLFHVQVQQSLQTITLLEESPILFNLREIEYEILTANALIGLHNLIQKEPKD